MVGTRIRKALEKFAPNLVFFDAQDILPGEDWRARLRRELKAANLLLLLLTGPARNDYDWVLYEAGLFDSLDEDDRRRVVCIYPDPAAGGSKAEEDVPSQLGDKQAVKATRQEILDLLMRLFHDQKFTNTVDPLNVRLSEKDLGPIAGRIADDINGVTTDR